MNLPRRASHGLQASALALLLAGCAQAPQRATVDPAAFAPEPDAAEDVTTAMSGVQFVTVPERFITTPMPQENLDTPAAWAAPDGALWLLATAKGTHRLQLFDGDSGRHLRSVGAKGAAPGALRRPNGVLVIDDVAMVVERDNRRVQVFALPSLAPLGSFGADALRKPYGLWAHRAGDAWEVIVSDAYMADDGDESVPPPAALDVRFRRYRVALREGVLDARETGTLGATEAAGAIRIPESLWGDPAHDRLLLAEEDASDGTRLKVYTLDGRYTGQDLGRGLFHAQAEGLALWACADGSGAWIATDQYKDRSVFHVFDRVTLAHRGAFAGTRTANTDGVWLHATPSAAFPQGVFYAVHDDQAVAAFDWRDIARALHLPAACP